MNRPRVLIVLILLAALVTRASIAHGQQQVINKEPEIKAGLVAIQGKLWIWPPAAAPAAGAPLKIGVLGADPFQQGGVNHLDKKLAGQNVVVERFATVDEYQPCHILVVSQAADLQTLLARTQTQGVLIIAQAAGLAKQGAVINLVVEQNRVRMEVNPEAAKRGGLTVDPRIYNLSMVKVVR
jgi:hypothetical protein